MLVRIFVLLLFPLIYSSCAAKKKHDISSHTSEDSSYKKSAFSEAEARRQEAMLMDVPIPLYTSRIPVTNYDQYGNQIVLGYQSSSTPDELITLYREQMGRHGWNLAQEFTGSESLLHFEKPMRACSISIRSRKKFFGKGGGSDLILYVEDSGIIL